MKPEQKLNLAIIGFALVAILMVAFLIFPFLTKIQQTSKELRSQKEKYLALAGQIQGLEDFRALYQDLAVFLEKIDKLFVDAEVPVDFIGFLENKAAESYLTINMSPSATGKVSGDYWPSLSFQVSLKGSFPNVMRFLEKLESSPYLLEIRNLNVSQADELAKVKTSLLIKVYTK